MAESAYRVRPASEADVPRILDLLKGSLGEGKIPRTVDFWNWKHRDNPFGESPCLVAEAGSGLVGVRVFMRWCFETETGTTVPVVRAVDTATDRAWQGKGIFADLTMRLLKEVGAAGTRFIYNTPNEKSRPGYLKMGWQVVGRVSLWVRVSRPHRMLSAYLRRDGSATSDDALEPVQNQWESVPDLAFDSLRSLGATSGRYHTRIDAPYLLWRYARCSAATYGCCFEPGKTFIVYRVRERGGFRELTLCEVLAERSAAGLRATVAALHRLIGTVGPDYTACAAHPLGFESAVMTASGFLPAPRLGPTLTVRPLAPVIVPDPLLPHSWGTSIGELELF